MVGLKANHQSTAVPSPNNGARMPLPKSGAAANLDLVGPLEFPDVDLGETSIKNRIWTYGRKNGCLEPKAVGFFVKFLKRNMANITIFIHFKKRNMSQEMCFFR